MKYLKYLLYLFLLAILFVLSPIIVLLLIELKGYFVIISLSILVIYPLFKLARSF